MRLEPLCKLTMRYAEGPDGIARHGRRGASSCRNSRCERMPARLHRCTATVVVECVASGVNRGPFVWARG